MGDEDGDDEADEEEEDDDDESDEEDEYEDDEEVQAKKLLNEEIRDLEAAVAKKNAEISSSANPLIRVSRTAYKYSSRLFILVQRRFEEAKKKLQADLDTKLAQRDEMKEKRRLQKEGISAEDAGSEAGDEGGRTMENDDLFGEDADHMDIG